MAKPIWVYRAPLANRRVADNEYRLWTMMRESTFELVRKQEAISSSEELAGRDWLEAYRWMMVQMAERIPGYRGQFPIWAWQSPKPDLRTAMCNHWPRPAVLVEWRAPVESVLLSNFYLWHSVLNKWYLSMTEAEGEAWNERARQVTGLQHASYEELPEDLRECVHQSWQRIFNTDSENYDPDWLGNDPRVQAVVPEMRFDQVIRARYLPEDPNCSHWNKDE